MEKAWHRIKREISLTDVGKEDCFVFIGLDNHLATVSPVRSVRNKRPRPYRGFTTMEWPY